MIWSLPETLKYIEPYIPDQLISANSFSCIQTIADLLPKAMSAYYIECRLGPNTPQVDFSTCALASTGSPEILAKYKLPDILVEDPLWRRLREFFKYWANPAAPPSKQVPLIWLEFDNVNESPPKAPLPSLGICLDPNYLGRQTRSPGSNHPNTRKIQPFTETALELLLDHPVPSITRQNLCACFDLLPAGGQISYICAMLPRHPMTLKVNGFVPKDRLLEYLTDIGWTGATVEIERLLNLFCQSLDQIRFDLTVGDEISSRMGIEFFFYTSSENGPQQRLLDGFVETGFCTPEKRDALLVWPGFSSEKYSRQSWPTRLGRFWYAKIVYQPNKPLEVKGYLGFAPSFFSLYA